MAKPLRLGGGCPHEEAFVKLAREVSLRHRLYSVFCDACEMAALSISNAVDKKNRDIREARYLQIVAKYSKNEVENLAQMLGELCLALESRPRDVLGSIFMAMGLGEEAKGQFFTPFELSLMMAKMLDPWTADAERKGFLTVYEPACGAGGMVIAVAQTLLDQGVNYQQKMHATCIDIDATACHMTYLQLSLLHVPAVIIHGNALSGERHGVWITPAHVMGGWDYRLHRAELARESSEVKTEGVQPERPPALILPAIAPSHETPIAVSVARSRLAEKGQLALFE